MRVPRPIIILIIIIIITGEYVALEEEMVVVVAVVINTAGLVVDHRDVVVGGQEGGCILIEGGTWIPLQVKGKTAATVGVAVAAAAVVWVVTTAIAPVDPAIAAKHRWNEIQIEQNNIKVEVEVAVVWEEVVAIDPWGSRVWDFTLMILFILQPNIIIDIIVHRNREEEEDFHLSLVHLLFLPPPLEEVILPAT